MSSKLNGFAEHGQANCFCHRQRFKGTEVEEVTQDVKAVKIEDKNKETKTEVAEVVDEVSHWGMKQSDMDKNTDSRHDEYS